MSLAEEDKGQAGLASRLRSICGSVNVTTVEGDRAFHGMDLYETGLIPAVVVRPSSTAQVAEIVRLARDEKRPVYVRGGGMSYSRAFLPSRPNAILLDMKGLNAIRTISLDDLFVTVEAGMSWSALDRELAKYGLRAAFWGPASGLQATIGGSLSQGTANHQSGQIETSSNAVLSHEIVTGTGDILRTGLDAQTGRLPNFRPYGPDMTGLFNADAGALGIKTAATLRLEPRPATEGGVSFAFSSVENMLSAAQRASHAGIASAIIAMDSETAGIRAGHRSIIADLRSMGTIVSTAHNPLRGLVRGTRIALAGRRVFDTATYTAHFLAEGIDEASLVAKECALRRLVSGHGDEIPSAAISMMRAQRFPALPTTDFTGRRLLPIHGIFPWSRAGALHQAYSRLVSGYAASLPTAEITLAEVFTGIGRGAVLFEPVFYWKDSLTDFHHRTRPEALGPLQETHADNPVARELVETLKSELVSLFAEHGAAHLQIGKLYPYMRDRQAGNAALLRQLKSLLDPDDIINPGALGLEGESA